LTRSFYGAIINIWGKLVKPQKGEDHDTDGLVASSDSVLLWIVLVCVWTRPEVREEQAGEGDAGKRSAGAARERGLDLPDDA